MTLIQTYEPGHDPIAAVYPVRPGDVGAHVFVAPGEDALQVGAGIFVWLFADPAVQRLVGEPDEANRAILARLEQTGFELGERVLIGDTRARMAYLTRERYASLAGRPDVGG